MATRGMEARLRFVRVGRHVTRDRSAGPPRTVRAPSRAARPAPAQITCLGVPMGEHAHLQKLASSPVLSVP